MQPDLAFDAQVCAVATAFAGPHAADAEVAAFVALFTPIVERPVRNILVPCPGCDVEQAVVDVFFKLWQKRAALPQNETAVFYVLRVAHNVAVDAYRTQKRRLSCVPLLPAEAAPAEKGEAAHQGAPHLRLELQELLGALPTDTRTVFLEYYYEGCGAQEIARRHSVKLPTVYSRLRRAKLLLRKHAANEAAEQGAVRKERTT